MMHDNGRYLTADETLTVAPYCEKRKDYFEE